MNPRDVEEAVMTLVMAARKDVSPQVMPGLGTTLGELGMDSLKLVEIIYELETRFAVAVDEELLAELNSIGDIVALIVRACEEPPQQAAMSSN